MFIDLAKAFDTVDHKILLRKMVKWLKKYLTNRKQKIQIRNIKNTDLKNAICGISQGINIRSSLIFDICKRPTICFKVIRHHYVLDTKNVFYHYITVTFIPTYKIR